MAGEMIDHEIIESVGIEIEFSNLDRKNKNIQRNMIEKNLRNYKLVHDASCESYKEFFADTNIPIEFEQNTDVETLAPIIRRAIIGGEIVSPIRHSGGPDWIKEIYTLVELLEQYGEDESSERDSFHVHVNVSRSAPLFVLKNLLRITLSLEAILFRLGGMGRINRGETNSYCFQRPFLGNGPPVVSQKWRNNKDSLIPICNPKMMMEAESKEQFFGYYGDSIFWAKNGGKYVTQRYMCVNFYPILTQGSFEFRTANKTLNPEYILAWTNFCKSLVEKSYTCLDIASYDQVERGFYENREISIDELLQAFEYYPKLDDATVEVLVDIWDKSPTPKFDNIWRYSHLREPTRFKNLDNATRETLEEKDVEEIDWIDIHHLEDQLRNNNQIRVGQGLGPEFMIREINNQDYIRGAQNIRINREHIDDRLISVGFDGRVNRRAEIYVEEMDFDFIVRWENDIYNLNLWRTGENRVEMAVYWHEEDYEDNRVIDFVRTINMERIIKQLYDGIHLDDVEY